MTIPKPSFLERASGSLATEAGLTVIGTIAGGALAPLLPILAKSLASARQQKRVEASLREISAILESHEQELLNLTDEQYKIINETVLTILQTTQDEKLKYLRAVIEKTLVESEILPEEASILSRIIRDISAEEIVFLQTACCYEGVTINESPQPQDEPMNKFLYVNPASQEALFVSGYLSLGLIVAGSPSWDFTPLRFTRIVASLLKLLQIDAQPSK
jgi:hypothetical protein